MAKVYDCIIIGGGAAGFGAAIYSARANMSTLCIAGVKGGSLTLANEIEDYPGFPDGIKGIELLKLFRKQAEKFGTEIISENVTKVSFKKKPFEIFADDEKYLAKTVIIATGASPKLLGIPSERKFWGRGVSTCAVCDGFLFKGKPVAIVGGSDVAIKEAIYLANLGCKVTVIHRRDKLRAIPILQKRAFANKSIKFAWDSEIAEILGDKFVSGIKIKNVKTGKTSEIKVNAVFVAIGHKPNTDFLLGNIKLNEESCAEVKGQSETSVPGVFTAGDVCDTRYMQAITAAAAGAKAALDAYKFLQET